MTKTINVGNIKIGGGNRISVQSMTNTDTANYEKTLEQICELEKPAVILCVWQWETTPI